MQVRAKLMILMILSSVTIIYFAYDRIAAEQNNLEKIKQAKEYIHATRFLVDVITELQKERGLSGFLFFDNNKSNRERLYRQRQLVDQKNTVFQQFFQQSLSLNKLNQSKLRLLLASLEKLKQARLMVDKEPAAQHYFTLYSEIIQACLEYIEHINAISLENTFAHDIRSYITLIHLQEAAAQEQSTLNKVFLSGILNSEHYRQLVALVSRQDYFLKLFEADAKPLFVESLKEKLYRMDNEKVIRLRNAALEKAIKNDLLNGIQIAIGYGGLIHYFKNYILRHDPVYKQQFEAKMQTLKSLVARYKSLKGMSRHENRYLDVILNTFKRYAQLLSVIDAMASEGKTVTEIDKSIKVNDAPALTAIGLLRNYVSGLNTSDWWQVSTQRILAIKTTALEIMSSVVNDASVIESKGKQALIAEFLSTVFIVLLVYTLGFALIKRIALKLTDITNQINRMRYSGNFDHFLHLDGDDEIANMANAFDALVLRQKHYQEDMWRQAYFDDLTGLANRKQCLEKMEEEIIRCQRNKREFAVMYIDLDRFKLINDTMGHMVGDALLVQVAERLKNAIRNTDLLARIGGDEFIIMMTEVKSITSVEIVASNILAAINQTFELEAYQAIVSTSIGIAMYPGDGADVATLLKNADTAMYQAKEKGKNQFQFFTEAMNRSVTHYMEVEQELHNALEYQQFELYYQPVISFRTGEIVSAEALIRWNDPDKGVRFPDEFIPIAEETGLIVPMGKWIIHSAVHQVKQWQQSIDYPIKVAVNISSRQFCDKANPIVDILTEALNRVEIDPEMIELEITENLLIESSTDLQNTFYAIKKMGMSVFLDDFGTGYSSLSYLKRFPIDVLKIDRSFIMDMDKNPEDRQLVSAIINMSKSLGMKVLAEGVETAEHVAILKQLGCDYAQGYYYSRPVPAKVLQKQFLSSKQKNNIISLNQKNGEK